MGINCLVRFSNPLFKSVGESDYQNPSCSLPSSFLYLCQTKSAQNFTSVDSLSSLEDCIGGFPQYEGGRLMLISDFWANWADFYFGAFR